MRKILGKDFFNRKTLVVAQDLLGKYLVRKIGRKIIVERITEVEAYVGAHDLACHSSKGRTKRAETMYCEAGTIYVYFVYGMYWMLNVVTEEKGHPSAILIRGTEHFKGPGVLTRELNITGALNGKKLGKKSGLWIAAPAIASSEGGNRKLKILKTPRVGVAYAGPVWSKKKYRFLLRS